MSKRRELLLLLGLALVTLATFVVSGLNVAAQQEGTSLMGSKRDLLAQANVVLAPLSVLLFAGAVHWALRRRLVRALLALPALPVWCGTLFSANTWIVDTLWKVIYVAPMQGIHPFGAPPS